VTRDYGTRPLLETGVNDPSASETVLRLLDSRAEITTRYGGGFVQSIDGLAGATDGTRRSDWFFYVNGIESPIGAADVDVHGGDAIWWDYRDWTNAMRVPAVVGSWPQPFASADPAAPQPNPVELDCMGQASTCEEVAGRLRGAGAQVQEGDGGEVSARVLVGPWSRVGRDPAAAMIDDGPGTSGVFARFQGSRLVALDQTASEAGTFGAGAGLVAAVREGEDPPTWVVTGTDDAGARDAAGVLDAKSLDDCYAVAVGGGDEQPLPVVR
jgi:Domain of unknown function (DUF4430)